MSAQKGMPYSPVQQLIRKFVSELPLNGKSKTGNKINNVFHNLKRDANCLFWIRLENISHESSQMKCTIAAVKNTLSKSSKTKTSASISLLFTL